MGEPTDDEAYEIIWLAASGVLSYAHGLAAAICATLGYFWVSMFLVVATVFFATVFFASMEVHSK